MSSSINIRPYRPDDKQAVFRLLSSFYASMSTEAEWRHLYMENPYGNAVISLAEKIPEKVIVGHYSVIKIPMTIFGKKITGGKGEGEIFDLQAIKKMLSEGNFIAKDISKRLLVQVMEGAKREGIEIVCTNPSDLALKSHLESGYKEVRHNFDIFVFPLKMKYIYHLLDKKIHAPFLSKLLSLALFPVFRFTHTFLKHKKDDVHFEQINSFDETSDMFIEKFLSAFDIITIDRNQKHLNWRFRNTEYLKFIIRSGGKNIGYAVLHIFKNPNGFMEANLADYLFLPDHWDKFSAAVGKAIRIAKDTGCDFLRINHMYDFKERFGVSRSLKNLLFLGRPDRRNIVVFVSEGLKELENSMLNADNWYFTDLYFEGY